MAYRRKTYKKKPRKTFKKRTYAKAPRLLNSINLGVGFPKKVTATLKYHDTILLNPGASYAVHNFSLNGLYDPDISGVGHQPLYFDQYMAIYNHYHVIGSKVRVNFFQKTNSLDEPFKVVLYENPDTVLSITNMDTLAEQSKSTYAAIINTTAPKTLTHSWSAKKTFGGSILGNDQLRGNSGANPAEGSYCAIMVRPVNPAAQVGEIWAQVHIEYVTVFSELHDMIGS